MFRFLFRTIFTLVLLGIVLLLFVKGGVLGGSGSPGEPSAAGSESIPERVTSAVGESLGELGDDLAQLAPGTGGEEQARPDPRRNQPERNLAPSDQVEEERFRARLRPEEPPRERRLDESPFVDIERELERTPKRSRGRPVEDIENF